jgi:ABC-type nickel/cobalt efflux system permease component RcnA
VEHAPVDDEVELPVGPAMRPRNMMAMGFAGGLVPSPSALVVLLGSIAIGRAWFGLLLIVAYGAGLASVLVGAGLLIERIRHRIQPILARRSHPRLAALAVNLPIVTAVLVVLGGAYLVVRAVTTA